MKQMIKYLVEKFNELKLVYKVLIIAFLLYVIFMFSRPFEIFYKFLILPFALLILIFFIIQSIKKR